MITVTVEKKYRMGTVKARVRAASIERVLQLAGQDARLVFPIDAERFFAPEGAPECVEELPVENEEVVAA